MRFFSLYMKKIIVGMLLYTKIIFVLPDFLENNEGTKDCVTLLDLHLTQKQKYMHMYIDRWERVVVYMAAFIPHQMHSPVGLGIK
jgi:hypothetical protein